MRYRSEPEPRLWRVALALAVLAVVAAWAILAWLEMLCGTPIACQRIADAAPLFTQAHVAQQETAR